VNKSTDYLIRQLEKNKFLFEQLFSDVNPKEISWKLNDEKWCLLEIICHLYDEEREDFRARVKLMLENPEKDLVPFNPVAWVTDRKYIEQSFAERLKQFLQEREQSISWLKGLENPQWSNNKLYGKYGEVTAHFFLSNWVAHDLLHIRQITRVRYDYVQQLSGVDVAYAGNWV